MEGDTWQFIQSCKYQLITLKVSHEDTDISGFYSSSGMALTMHILFSQVVESSHREMWTLSLFLVASGLLRKFGTSH
jgi:hypothetical protein